MKKLRTKLFTLLSAIAMLFTALPSVPAYAADLTEKNVFITYTGQVVDSFMGVDAVYSTYYSWSGYYSCAAYIDKFYHKFFDVNLYDINNYEGKPHVYYPVTGHTAELRTVSNPIPGDIMQDKAYSHVAIVKAVSGSQVTLIEQNWKWDDWQTGDPICTVNRKVNVADNYFYRLYIDGVAQTVSKPAPTITSASASSITKDGFTVKASAKDDIGIDHFMFMTYPKSKGTSAAKKVTVSKSGTSASASVNVKVSDFENEAGTYVTAVYVYNTSGKKVKTKINTVVVRKPPVISAVKVTGKSSTGYTVTCNVESKAKLSSVKFPTWTSYNSTDDLASNWSKTTVCDGKIVGSTVSFTVKAADHNKEKGEYNTYIYAYDTYGNVSSKAVQVNLSKSVSEVGIESIPSQIYTGNALRPEVHLYDGNKPLILGVDYSVSYSDNKEVGKGSVRITGLGSYSGSKLVYFKIRPAKVTGLTVAGATDTSVSFKWDANANADYYFVYRRIDGSWKHIGTTADTSYKAAGLTNGSNYEFSVIAHKDVNGVSFNGVRSAALKAVTKPLQTANVKAAKSGTSVTVSWSKLARCDGYAVYTSTDGTTYTRKAYIDDPSAASYKFTAQKGKLYIKIRAYKLLGSTHYFGSYSSVVSLTV